MTSIRLASNVEVLLLVLGELLEEEGEKSIDVLSRGDCVAHRTITVREADIDWLVEEDHRSVRVPRISVVDEIEVFINGTRTKFEKQSRER